MIGSKEERIVMLALYISSNGLLCKIGNPYINIPANTFLCILAKSISYIAKNINNGVLFISIFPDNKFSDKEHLQCQLIVVITSRIIIYVIFEFAEKVKSIRKFLKYKKLKKSSPKIEIIPLPLRI